MFWLLLFLVVAAGIVARQNAVDRGRRPAEQPAGGAHHAGGAAGRPQAARSARRRAAGPSRRVAETLGLHEPVRFRGHLPRRCPRTRGADEPHRRASLPAGLLRAGRFALVLVRAAQLQLVQGERWAEQAESQRTARDTLEARRGSIYDRRGVPLAVTQEFYHVGHRAERGGGPPRAGAGGWRARSASRRASSQRPLRAGAVRLLLRSLHRHRDRAAAQAQGRAPRGQLPPRLSDSVARGAGDRPARRRQRLAAAPGSSGRSTASSPAGPARRCSSATGVGRRLESPARRRSATRCRATTCGSRSTAELQDIAERALEDALHDLDARGRRHRRPRPALRRGARDGLAPGRGPIGRVGPPPSPTPSSPGSTAKLFTAAALLRLGRVDSADAVSGEGGKLMVAASARGHADHHGRAQGVRRRSRWPTRSRCRATSRWRKFSQRLTRDGAVRRRCATSGSAARRASSSPRSRAGRSRRPEQMAGHVHPCQHGDGLRVRGDGAAAGLGVRRHRQRRRADDADAGARGARARRPSCCTATSPSRCGASSPPASRRRCRRYLRQRGGARRGHGRRGAQLANYELAGKTGTARRFVDRRYAGLPASFAAFFPGEGPAARDRGEDRQPRRRGPTTAARRPRR